jgi:hypothetical protein
LSKSQYHILGASLGSYRYAEKLVRNPKYNRCLCPNLKCV